MEIQSAFFGYDFYHNDKGYQHGVSLGRMGRFTINAEADIDDIVQQMSVEIKESLKDGWKQYNEDK